jgi:hypothetical protein
LFNFQKSNQAHEEQFMINRRVCWVLMYVDMFWCPRLLDWLRSKPARHHGGNPFRLVPMAAGNCPLTGEYRILYSDDGAFGNGSNPFPETPKWSAVMPCLAETTEFLITGPRWRLVIVLRRFWLVRVASIKVSVSMGSDTAAETRLQRPFTDSIKKLASTCERLGSQKVIPTEVLKVLI